MNSAEAVGMRLPTPEGFAPLDPVSFTQEKGGEVIMPSGR